MCSQSHPLSAYAEIYKRRYRLYLWKIQKEEQEKKKERKKEQRRNIESTGKQGLKWQ